MYQDSSGDAARDDPLTAAWRAGRLLQIPRMITIMDPSRVHNNLDVNNKIARANADA